MADVDVEMTSTSTDIQPVSPELLSRYDSLWTSFLSGEIGHESPPLLAHYTSISVMEKIFKTGEVWFSNPLFMNDLQEMRFGLSEGERLFSDPDLLKSAGGSDARAGLLQNCFSFYLNKFVNEGALDMYIFCLSEHKKSDDDGLLSMWRGYGQHGSGVALVFNAENITEVPESPFVFYKVSYSSNVDRQETLIRLLKEWGEITASLNLQDKELFAASYTAYYVIKIFSIICKHIGFSEENEWRIVYDPERDQGGLLKSALDYHIGDRGVEPKLRYKISHLPGVSAPDIGLDRLLERIILGPSLSSPLAVKSVERMLDKIERPNFKSLIRASGIPLRPLSGSSF
jgi:hypothetical protein